ncbi:MAG TPA: AmmeMemoRadiSam system protein A [Gemmatimonadales bacterium]|nr:AmmeMemoRadiSam system protein A [Gemmatimonadales bacterium]
MAPTPSAGESPTIADPELTPADRAALLDLARATLAALVAGRPLPSVPGVPGAALKRGAFVTLTERGALRGCIGHLAADRALGPVVRDMTVAAAQDDPRFPPVTPDELPSLAVEISVLSAPTPLGPPVAAAAVAVGRDGLVVRRGPHVGLLLPQVATEYHWGPEAFLAATCRKAGLGPDGWREPETEVFTFQADVFGEARAAASERGDG